MSVQSLGRGWSRTYHAAAEAFWTAVGTFLFRRVGGCDERVRYHRERRS